MPPRTASSTRPTIGQRKRCIPVLFTALSPVYATCRTPEVSAAVRPDTYDDNSDGRFVGSTPPGASLCTTFGSMNASAEAAEAAESPAREAMVLIALLPRAFSHLSALV